MNVAVNLRGTYITTSRDGIFRQHLDRLLQRDAAGLLLPKPVTFTSTGDTHGIALVVRHAFWRMIGNPVAGPHSAAIAGSGSCAWSGPVPTMDFRSCVANLTSRIIAIKSLRSWCLKPETGLKIWLLR